jgi:tetratricopeptide (TPR) repeat protein
LDSRVRWDELLKKLELAESDTSKCVIYDKLSLELMKSDGAKALEYAQKCLEYAQKSKNEKYIGTGHSILGNALSNIDSLDEAEKNMKISIEIFSKLKINKSLAMCWNNMGVIYKRKSDFANELTCYEKALKLRLIENDSVGMGMSYNQLSNRDYEQKA